jgi:hypothetical protein
MAIGSLQDGLYKSIDEIDNRKTFIRTGKQESLLSGISYDDIQATYPDPLTVIYSYYFNSNLVAQIEVTYSQPNQKGFLRARRI